MKFLQKLERKFGRYAIPNLMLYILILNAVGMFLTMVNSSWIDMVRWSVPRILEGQIWRIVSFLLVPYETNPLMFLIYAFVYYSIAQMLERTWGTFLMNLYIITGILGTILGGVIVYLLFGVTANPSISYLSNSLFLALAAAYPDAQFLLMFIIPVKAKWMALLGILMYVYELMQIVTYVGWYPFGIVTVIMIIMSLLNFILFFYLFGRNKVRLTRVQRARSAEFHKKMAQPAGKPLHKCTVCGRTDREFPDLEFRYCSRCEGAYEYCSEHLYTHKHVSANQNESQS